MFRDKPAVISVWVSLLVFSGLLGLRLSGSLESLELAMYDGYIRLRPHVATAKTRIALITITERDIRQLGRWPLSDADLVQAFAKILSYRPRAIGLDMYRDVPVPPGHEDLNAMLTSHPQIITVMKFGRDVASSVFAPPVLANTPQVGFNDILVDPGGIVRRALLFLDHGNQVAYSFALRLALLALQAEQIQPRPAPDNPSHLRLGPTTMRPLEAYDGPYINADAGGYQFWLDFRDAPQAFPAYSLDTLLSDGIDATALRDKIVMIGVTADSVKDFFYTPLSRGLHTNQQMTGIELHAHIVSQLLRTALDGHYPLVTLSEYQEAFWLLVWSVLGGMIGLWRRSPWRFALLTVCGLLLLGLITYTAFVFGCFLPLVPPAMAWVIAAAGVTVYLSNREKEERKLLMQLFAQHVSAEVADTIWQQRDDFLDGRRPRPQKMMVTVLLSDLEGFTPLSEQLEPQPLMDWLNTYMEAMAQLVTEHGGIVDDYAGDGLKADFGVPLARTTEAEIRQDAVNAVRCALAMEQTMYRLNVDFEARNLPTASMRVGIYTGFVVAGSMGSVQRLKYTTIGDTVNTAARLENAAKTLVPPVTPCRILIGDTTVQYLNDDFQIHRIGDINLRGKSHLVTAYHITGQYNPSTVF
jgi:adenylate cyclase